MQSSSCWVSLFNAQVLKNQPAKGILDLTMEWYRRRPSFPWINIKVMLPSMPLQITTVINQLFDKLLPLHATFKLISAVWTSTWGIAGFSSIIN